MDRQRDNGRGRLRCKQVSRHVSSCRNQPSHPKLKVEFFDVSQLQLRRWKATICHAYAARSHISSFESPVHTHTHKSLLLLASYLSNLERGLWQNSTMLGNATPRLWIWCCETKGAPPFLAPSLASLLSPASREIRKVLSCSSASAGGSLAKEQLPATVWTTAAADWTTAC